MARGSSFGSVRVVGGLIPGGLLERVGAQDASLEGVGPSDYYLAPGERIGEAITRSWNRLHTLWERFAGRLEESGALTGPTRQEWLLPLFQELGFGHVDAAPGLELEGKAYPISHLWQSIPVHLVGAGVDLERRSPGVVGAASASPHGLVQEFLNRSEDHLWGVVSNGRRLRLLRDNASLTRTAFVQFDLEEMFGGEVYSDFVLLWLTCHASRLEGPAGKQVLEQWREEAARQGVRALDALRDGVETAIEALGSAAIAHPDNVRFRQQLEDGSINAQELYRQLLRVVYRLLFLLVAESRDLLTKRGTDSQTRARYRLHYSVTRLRDQAESTRGGAHGDLWQQHLVVAKALEAAGEPALGLPALGGFLWSAEATDALNEVTIPNQALLTAIRALTTVRPDGGLTQRVDYANLGSEELGSIYESLLEYVPEINPVAGTFELQTAAGNERKTTGSYYTPTSLINELLNSALDPVVDEAASSDNPEQAILDLKVVDPAAGSGHFLIAAANRIADRLARVRTGDDEPSPDQLHTALRDVISHCIYAVDINSMAVELAKVALWIEAMQPGKPLTFLDHHIVSGNSLLGVTPRLLEQGIPDDAYLALKGDDRELAKVLKMRNLQERKKGLVALPFGDSQQRLLHEAAAEIEAIDRLDDTTLDLITEKERRYERLIDSREQQSLRLAADAWVAAFFAAKDEHSPQITTATVNAALTDPDSVNALLADQVGTVARRLRFHHWHLAFPHVFVGTSRNIETGWSGGFDVVLGNPPWEHTELKEKEWFASRYPEIAAASTGAIRKRLIDSLRDTDPQTHSRFLTERHDADAISLFARESGVFPLCGRGRINTYALFCETSLKILGQRGHFGIIVPTGIATDHTTKEYFAEVASTGRLLLLADFENRTGFFPSVHSSARFVLLAVGPASDKEARFSFFLRDVAELSDPDRSYTLSPADVSLINPNTKTAPAFRNRRDADIARRVYRSLPVMRSLNRDCAAPWDLQLVREFNMTSESDKFRTAGDLEAVGATAVGNEYRKEGMIWLPLYEAKMMDHYDHRAADVVISETALVRQGQPNAIADSDHIDPSRFAVPRYWLHSAEVAKKLNGRAEAYLLTFREVTAPTNRRTMVPALIPWSAVGYKLWIVLPEIRRDSLALAAMLSSFVFDYLSRQKVGGTTMAAFLVEQLPVIPKEELQGPCPWDTETQATSWIEVRVAELSGTSWDMVDVVRDGVGLDRPFVWSPDRRVALSAEIDAAFFHLYGISRDELAYVMDTFPIVKRKDTAEHGSYRTKESILDTYDLMTVAIETGQPYQTILDPPPADPSLCHPPRSSEGD
jgi:hypothetical protein